MRKSRYGRILDMERARRRAAEAAPRVHPVFSEEPCEHCGQSSERSHPGGVISRRWLCHKCGRWQGAADPQAPKVITQVEGYGFQRAFDPSGLDILEESIFEHTAAAVEAGILPVDAEGLV